MKIPHYFDKILVLIGFLITLLGVLGLALPLLPGFLLIFVGLSLMAAKNPKIRKRVNLLKTKIRMKLKKIKFKANRSKH